MWPRTTVMVLDKDADVTIPLTLSIAKNNINIDVLARIDNDLEPEEKLSVMFLMTCGYNEAFDTVFNLFMKAKEAKACILPQFIRIINVRNWEESILEAICVINNQSIIKKLGISYEEVRQKYRPENRLCSENLNRVAKCLYALCESLTDNETSLLLNYVQNDKIEQDYRLKNINDLELHLLYWIKTGYISLKSTSGGNFKTLFKHLKKFDHLELLSIDLEQCLHISQTTMHSETSIDKEHINNQEEESDTAKKKINTGLCIIINQMFFLGRQYEARIGTDADCKMLHTTFAGFGFEVKTFDNLSKRDMLQTLTNIPKNFGSTYECLFVCILSHGCKGSVIASDELEVTLEEIECHICCADLKDVIKIVIVQACQGDKTGRINPSLALDGPTKNSNNLDIAEYRHFGIFMSTMQGFVSIRDTAKGSWFIQEFCKTLQNGQNDSFLTTISKVVSKVQNKRGVMDGMTSVAVLPELRIWRIETDFLLPKYMFCVK